MPLPGMLSVGDKKGDSECTMRIFVMTVPLLSISDSRPHIWVFSEIRCGMSGFYPIVPDSLDILCDILTTRLAEGGRAFALPV